MDGGTPGTAICRINERRFQTMLNLFKKGLTLAAGCMLAFAAQSADVRDINVTAGKTMQNQGALLLDVREPDEYAAGHAPGSILIPLGQLKTRLDEIRASERKPVAVICRSGRRSAQAADILQKSGFATVYNVQGGMIAWEEAGFPVIRAGKQAP
jgi:rhodanese-related sulfurtransferase